MQFGLYAPIPMATVGSPEVNKANAEALMPLPHGSVDAQFEFGVDLLLAADRIGFDIVLFAERHLGSDLSAWVLASAIGSRLNHIRALVAVHPGLWDPVMVGKLAVSVDRVCRGRMALNIVNGWFDEEFRMFGGTVLQGEERYRRTIEFIDILRGLWTHEKFSYAGQFYKLDDGQLLLKPASPSPPGHLLGEPKRPRPRLHRRALRLVVCRLSKDGGDDQRCSARHRRRRSRT